MIRAAAMACLLAWPAAGQEALYGAQPPAGSAYVRFANGTGQPLTVSSAALPDQVMATDDARRITPYRVVEHVAARPVTVTVQDGGHTVSADLRLPPDGFATVLLRRAAQGGITATALADGADFNQARARLSFYNATPACGGAGLSLAPGGAAVFADLAPGSSRSRTINPVTASVRASCSDGAAPDVALSGMEVGGSYSVWLMQPADRAVAFVSRDATSPYQR